MLRTATEYDERYSQHPFWTDGKKVYYRHYEIKGVDKDSFEVLGDCMPVIRNIVIFRAIALLGQTVRAL
ncbi:DKNYY family protein [Capnocytophaga haemolytica]|jgi:hypothetical protein|uniref:Uncharacterized protein n=1 Tax=Capnocytophaga haemolytica TaxID=45243 RepID=A0AAX2H0H6_9FLAO|nr:DKNYY domain-containing protein [Capnocytophaga haemolytica]AMD84125.1 hypothetical protein AXF12_00365 [Capnocytophaga haemolytica]SFO07320.1 DKNYY family protein [Capnocytophaga haemolytica]SNV13258.1 Uncharacterised protein [Capnocytophaga haemolytica]